VLGHKTAWYLMPGSQNILKLAYNSRPVLYQYIDAVKDIGGQWTKIYAVSRAHWRANVTLIYLDLTR